MGVYDTVKIGDRVGQVKLWECRLARLTNGDSVPPIDGQRNYDVAMRDGGYVHVHDLRIVGWTDARLYPFAVDKWGMVWESDEHNAGLLGESYFHVKREKSDVE